MNMQITQDEMTDWACTTALARLGFATSTEIAAFYDLIPPAAARLWCAQALRDHRILEVDIECADKSRRSSFVLAEILNTPTPAPSARVRLLSPFDPALRDRKRAERLFGFHYRIEIFVPASKRKYGYYVFPVLQGTRLIGRIDAKRDGDALTVTAFWPEQGVRMGEARRQALSAEVERAARFVGSTQINWAPDWVRDNS